MTDDINVINTLYPYTDKYFFSNSTSVPITFLLLKYRFIITFTTVRDVININLIVPNTTFNILYTTRVIDPNGISESSGTAALNATTTVGTISNILHYGVNIQIDMVSSTYIEWRRADFLYKSGIVIGCVELKGHTANNRPIKP